MYNCTVGGRTWLGGGPSWEADLALFARLRKSQTRLNKADSGAWNSSFTQPYKPEALTVPPTLSTASVHCPHPM